MKIHPNSLSKTVDSVSEAFFFGHSTNKKEREDIALWIARQQGKPGCYANMFAPSPSDLKNGIQLFTGEKLGPSASLRHVTGEEACRALILLKPQSKTVKSALRIATDSMIPRLDSFQPNRDGFWCCGTCDPALWRHLAVGGLKGVEQWLDIGLKTLRAHRDQKGKWRRFPFYYTLLALSELDHPKALVEIRYVAPKCEAYLKRHAKIDAPSAPIIHRRRAVCDRALAKL